MIKKVIFNLIILLSLVNYVYAPDFGNEKLDFAEKSLSSSDYSNPSAYPTIFQNPNFQINQVPEQYVQLIPSDKVNETAKELSSSQQSYLTTDQLIY